MTKKGFKRQAHRHSFLKGNLGLLLKVVMHSSDQITGRIGSTTEERKEAVRFIFTNSLENFVKYYGIGEDKLDPTKFRNSIIREMQEREAIVDDMSKEKCRDCMHCVVKDNICRCKYGAFYGVKLEELDYISNGFGEGCNLREVMDD